MSRSARLMQLFFRALRKWTPTIMKTALLTELEFIPTEVGEFTVVARWKSRVDEGEWRKHYTRSTVFVSETAPRPQLRKGVCNFKDDIVREILHVRGINR